MIDRTKPDSSTWAICIALVLLVTGAGPTNAGTWDFATGPAIGDAEGERDWGVEIVPYLWLAGLSGEMGLPAVGTIPVDVSFSDLASNLDAAFAGFMDARYRRWHLLIDGAWVQLRNTVAPPQTALELADLSASVAFGLGGVSYELPLDWPVALELYLAGRWWHVNADALILTAGPPVAGGMTEVWADAIVGTRIRYPLGEKWRFGLTADIGAGNADLDWQVLGYVNYMFNPHFGLTAAYRILGVDYSNRGFVYDLRQSGLLLGINFAY
ncbi:MAG: hypothetical protein JRG92_10795 [Deltaproteobacteria bacterium]|nr:hypothetical protein [Deltaproteobacteria bacterium]